MTLHPSLPLAPAFELIYTLSQGNPKNTVAVHDFELRFGGIYAPNVKTGCLLYFSQMNYITCSPDNKSFRITGPGEKSWRDFVNRPPGDLNKDFP
jgi:hypothetical protein